MKKIVFVMLLIFAFLTVLSPRIWAMEVEATELLHLRTSNQKIFSLSNGNYRYIQYENPIHYFNEGKYIEYDFSLDNLSKNKLANRSSDFSVIYENNLTDMTAELSFNGENKLTYQLPAINNSTDLNSNIQMNSKSVHELKFGSIALSSSSSGFNLTEKIYTDNQTTLEYAIQVDDTLSLSFNDKTYEFVDKNGVPVYSFEHVLLIDSNGLMTQNSQLTIIELKDGEYHIIVELDNNFLNDDNIVYPIQMRLSTNYVHNRDYHYIRDKVYVKDTGLQHDTSVFQVAKTKFAFFDPDVEPVSLSQYHHYGLIEIYIEGLLPSMDIIEAELILHQTASNTTDSIPLSKVTSHSFDSINGYVNYTKSSIQTKSVVNGLLTYDLLTTLNTAISNEETLLLLELSPLNINLGASTNKYNAFLPVNERSAESTMLVIEFESLESIYNTTYGYAGFYEQVNTPYWNCLEYIIRTELEDNFIKDGYGSNVFFAYLSSGQFDFNFEQDVIDAIYWTLLFAGYASRPISGYDYEIFVDEYRIAFRIGNTSNDINFDMYPSGAWDDVEDDWHFMMQHSDGRWSHKSGDFMSRVLDYGQNPDMNIWHMYKVNELNSPYIPNFYDSTTYYFAIKPL